MYRKVVILPLAVLLLWVNLGTASQNSLRIAELQKIIAEFQENTESKLLKKMN